MGFELRREKGVEFYTSSLLNKSGAARHFFSTRIGGVSEPPFFSLNLGLYTSDREENLIENYRKIFEAAEMNLEGLTYLYQVHGDSFHLVNNNNIKEVLGNDGDALITTSRGVAIGVLTADCIPVLLLDPRTGCAAAIHAGWKGTSLGIVRKVVSNMIEVHGCSANDIYGAIGPGIGHCCFEVGSEVGEKFSFVQAKGDKSFVDLWKENESQLIAAGIGSERIDISGLCTMCNKDRFFSYRGEAGSTGRMGSFIQLI